MGNVPSSQKVSRAQFDDRVEQMFREADKNGDGTITVAEMKGIIEVTSKNSGSLNPNVTEETIRALIEVRDENNDGKLDLKEFKNLMAHIGAGLVKD